MQSGIQTQIANYGVDLTSAGGVGTNLYSNIFQSIYGTMQGIYIGADCDLTLDFGSVEATLTGCKAGSVLPIVCNNIKTVTGAVEDSVVILTYK